MTDEEKFETYAQRIEPTRRTYHEKQVALEQEAADGISRDLAELRGVHGDVIAFIEERWTKWLDACISLLDQEYRADQDRLREELEIT